MNRGEPWAPTTSIPAAVIKPKKATHPPAGSQADKQSQRDEFAASQNQQRAMNDAFASASSTGGWSSGSGTSSSSRSSRRQSATSTATTKQTASRTSKQRHTKTASLPRPQRPWNPLVGIIAFLAVTTLVGTRMTGDNKWILAATIGLVAGAIIGRLWKPMLVVAVLAGAAWLYLRSSGTPSPHTDTTTSALTAPISVQPAPPTYGATGPVAPLPNFVPASPSPAPASAPPRSLFGPGGRAAASATAQLLHGFGIVEFYLESPCDLQDITRLEYQAGTSQVTAILATGERLPVGLDVAANDRAAWAAATSVQFFQIGVANIVASIPISHTP